MREAVATPDPLREPAVISEVAARSPAETAASQGPAEKQEASQGPAETAASQGPAEKQEASRAPVETAVVARAAE